MQAEINVYKDISQEFRELEKILETVSLSTIDRFALKSKVAKIERIYTKNIDTPYLEKTELYIRALEEELDILKGKLKYAIKKCRTYLKLLGTIYELLKQDEVVDKYWATSDACEYKEYFDAIDKAMDSVI